MNASKFTVPASPHIGSLSPDMIIIGIILLSVIICGILGATKAKIFALSAYMGIVLSTQLATIISDSKYASFASSNQVRLALLGLPVVLFGLFHGKARHQARGSSILALIIGALTACVIVSSGLLLLDGATLKEVLDGSTIASVLYKLRFVWLGATPLVLLLSLFTSKKKH